MIEPYNILYFAVSTREPVAIGADWSKGDLSPVTEIAWQYRGMKKSFLLQRDDVHFWSFPEVAVEFINDCHRAPLICAHNIRSATNAVKSGIIASLGPQWYASANVEGALYKGKRIDTMLLAKGWVDARRSDGTLKFPTFEELFAKCFKVPYSFHGALGEAGALYQCLKVLVTEGVVELKPREYPGENIENARNALISAINDEINKLYGSGVQAPQKEN